LPLLQQCSQQSAILAKEKEKAVMQISQQYEAILKEMVCNCTFRLNC